jgi:FkbM family methyltransferase
MGKVRNLDMQFNGETKSVKKISKLLIKKLLQVFDLTITSNSNLVRLNALASKTPADSDLAFLRVFAAEDAGKILHLLLSSKSQLRQDLFVLTELNFKKSGYFVEFGATNGIDLSNTYLLEKDYSWRGILAEPAKVWHTELRENRKNSIVEIKCVWKNSNETLLFNETNAPELSTLDSFSDSDAHTDFRKHGNKYEVSSISLNDLLDKHKAPRDIDYLSIDTEGSEFEILNSFNFDNYNIKIITCEHNFSKNRDRIHSLLVSKGYERKFESISLFDDWYVKIK